MRKPAELDRYVGSGAVGLERSPTAPFVQVVRRGYLMNREQQPSSHASGAEYRERTHPVGQTGGSPDREARTVEAQCLSFNLPAEIERLHEEDVWGREDRNSK